MRRRSLAPTLLFAPFALVLLHVGTARADGGAFDFGATLRVDLYHIGDHNTEQFTVDQLIREGAWPGSRANLVDGRGLGSARFEVFADKGGNKPLISQGFCTLFGEWRTTTEAKSIKKTFSETVRMPLPRQPVKLVLSSRNKKGKMVKVFETRLDPASLAISRERRRGGLRRVKLHHSGPAATSLDIVVLGDGYEAWQMDKYRQDARRFARTLLAAPPFSRMRDRINIWGVESPSRQSGVDEPRKGIFRDTVLGMSFNTFGSARYLMTGENRAVRDVAGNVPYDAIYIMSNTSRYGGGGIYNLYASFVSDNEYDKYVFVHEFGHSFAGLADEYYTSKVSYNEMYPRGVEPWEPNITAARSRGKVKWRAMIAPKTPVPTPAKHDTYADTVGLFEGAGYSAKGLFRSSVDCKMFGKGHKPFCPVCMGAVKQTIESYLK